MNILNILCVGNKSPMQRGFLKKKNQKKKVYKKKKKKKKKNRKDCLS